MTARIALGGLCQQHPKMTIAVAYCAAKARAALGTLPERIEVRASGNVIKNVKSVVVPSTNGGRGIAVAAAIGVLGGDENAELDVISHVSDEAKARLSDYLAATLVEVQPLESAHILDLSVAVFAGGHHARVRIADKHTNIVLIERDGEIVCEKARPLRRSRRQTSWTIPCCRCRASATLPRPATLRTSRPCCGAKSN